MNLYHIVIVGFLEMDLRKTTNQFFFSENLRDVFEMTVLNKSLPSNLLKNVRRWTLCQSSFSAVVLREKKI